MRKIKQSSAKNVMLLMTDSADHITGKTGLTLTVMASKDGGAFASITPTVTERSYGTYNIALTSAHTNTLGDLALHVSAAGADPADLILLVEAGATDADVSTRSTFAGGAVASVTGAVGSVTGLNPALLDAAVTSRMATFTYTSPPSAVAIRTEIDTNSTKLDAAISTRMATFAYTAAPTAAQVRTEIDTNSTKLDVAVGTRLATAGYAAAPSAVAIRTEIDANSTKLDAAISTRMATFAYTAPPTVGAIRAEMDSNSTKLDVAISTRMATFAYTAPDNAGVTAIKAKTDQLAFTVANQVDSNALSGGGSGIDAAGVRAAIGMSSANMDTQLSGISGKLPALVGGRVDASVGAMAANVLTAAAIAAGALNGKGNWNIGKTGYVLTITPPTAANVADAVWSKVLP